jgi:tRNA wybutosine-synthesizing protein 1
MDPALRRLLMRQHYAVVGNHSAVKLCHWTKESLLHGRQCYKQEFYGIRSHRCLQMSPAVNACSHMCLFCWRIQTFTEQGIEQPDDPELILEEAVRAQQKLLTGYKGDARTDPVKYVEAQQPSMVACSLAGEPTLYPRLGEFFAACHRRDMTTFLVTNGTTPEVIRRLDPLPRQLYLSVVAPTEEVYQRVCAPLIPDGWQKITETLSVLRSLSTRTVIRHTLVKGWNMDPNHVPAYAALIAKAEPDFIEAKGFVFVGSSRGRMHFDAMPSHEDVRAFAEHLAAATGYTVTKEKPDSLVVLLEKRK